MKMINLPKHKNCRNCGDCCGPIPISLNEEKAIEAYLKKNIFIINKLKKQNRGILDCQFRDKEAKLCAIYEVRPLICRLFGITRGMTCSFGNSAEINGYPYVMDEKRKLIKKFY